MQNGDNIEPAGLFVHDGLLFLYIIISYIHVFYKAVFHGIAIAVIYAPTLYPGLKPWPMKTCTTAFANASPA